MKLSTICRSYKPLIIFTLITIFLINSLSYVEPVNAKNIPLRGIWISYGDFQAAGLYDKSKTEFSNNADVMFAKLKKYGFNNVYFHVRANDDSIYPDSIFKWCKSISQKPLAYDALKILIDKSHKYNIRFHAWINPYRIDNEHIYNPAKSSTTEHIIDGVLEIIENYNVDGIHFDDYFYPSKHKGNKYYSVSINNRKKYVNKMVHSVYKTIKNYNSDIQFGISPAGNISYAESIGCDIETWTNQEGYVDYILPQLYWSDNYRLNGKKTKLFTNSLDEWTDYGTGDIPVYIGLALYKAGAASAWDPGWKYSNNLAKQTTLSKDYGCQGYVLFSYRYLFTKAGKKEIASYLSKISRFRLTTASLTLRKGKHYNLSKNISIDSDFSFKYSYSTLNKKIASVTSKGIIKARKKGCTFIVVKGLSGCKVSCRINVK